MKKLALGLAALCISGCASPSAVTVQPAAIYQLTLSATLDGTAFTGTAVGSSAESHTISISSSDSIPYVILKTCHRSEMHEKIISQGWFSENKTWNLGYIQADTIEDNGDCPARLCAYSNTVGALPVQCAVIDFKNAKYTLPAENICNGADGQASGTMLCHTQVSLIERVKFQESVVVAPPIPSTGANSPPYAILNQCQGVFLDAPQNTLFQYVMPASECYLIFDTVKAPHRRAKLMAIPYNTPQPTTGGS